MILCADEATPPPRPTFLGLVCAGCSRHWGVYCQDDYLKQRKAAEVEGWRRRRNEWFFGECVPTGGGDNEA